MTEDGKNKLIEIETLKNIPETKVKVKDMLKHFKIKYKLIEKA